MAKQISFWLFVLAMTLLMSMARLGYAHDNVMWSDAGKFGPCFGHTNCGMGYYLCWDCEGNGYPVLFAPTAHNLNAGHTFKSCDDLFTFLEECSEPTTDAEISYCTGDMNPADPIEEWDGLIY